MNFVKTFFASCLGSTLALLFVLTLLFLGLVGLISLSSDDTVVVEKGSVLRIKIDGLFNEREVDNPLDELPIPGAVESNTGLIDLVEAIEHAATDEKIEGILLEVEQPITYYSTIREIREGLNRFREKGKWILAHNEVYSEGGYYLASVADEVFMNPHGSVTFNGLSAEFVSFKRLLDKLEIRPQVFRVGTYKSAVEPFLMERMSDENRLQLTEMITSIQHVLLADIATSRNTQAETLGKIADGMLVRSADDAVAHGLVDGLLYTDEMDSLIESKLGKKPTYISYKKYQKTVVNTRTSKNEIAVIVAEGTIMPGKSGQSNEVIGSVTFLEQLQKARENKNVKAIVLRVNSPGGESQSSDIIWRETQLARMEKPVIASMGDYAASGGYYISMGCDTIVANPTTITGSIGIFGVLFDLSDFLGNKLGVTFDEVKTGEFGELYTVTRPLTEVERAIIQTDLERFYDSFITHVAEGRGLSKEKAMELAGGRVWTGAQAIELGLVDVLGGLNDAIRIAAEKAGVGDDYKVRYYPRQLPFIEQLFAELEDQTKINWLRQSLGEEYGWYQQLNRVRSYQGAQARLPFEFTLD